MSTETPGRDPDTEPIRAVGSSERKRAALVLGVLAVAAVLVAVIMVYTLGSSNSPSPSSPVAIPTGPSVTGSHSPTQTSRPPTKTATKPKPTTHSNTPQRGPVSCPTPAPCGLPSDIGNAVQALNAYRTSHGRPAVTGSVTPAARRCAVHNGDGNSCPSGYFWEPVGRSGSQVITKIAAQGKGVGWLLNPKMTAVQVGWAYVPSSKSFECVLVSNA